MTGDRSVDAPQRSDAPAPVFGHRSKLRYLQSVGLLPIVLALLVIVFGIYEPRFWRTINLINILRGSSYLMIVAAAQMLVLVIGGFDLSVGAVVSLTSVTVAVTMTNFTHLMPELTWLAILAGVLAGLVAGTMIGVVNGVTIALLKVSPFMVTLATMSIAIGIGLLVTNGVPVYGMPDVFMSKFGQYNWLGLPISVYPMFVLLVSVWWIMNWTKLGRYIYAIGSNEHAARTSGIPTFFYILITYGLCSFLSAIAGVLLTARYGSGEAFLGDAFMLQSIAASVIGGVSLRGGVGRIEMVAIGALFLQIVTNGMNLIRVDTKMQTIVVGIILVVAVGLDRFKILGRR